MKKKKQATYIYGICPRFPSKPKGQRFKPLSIKVQPKAEIQSHWNQNTDAITVKANNHLLQQNKNN